MLKLLCIDIAEFKKTVYPQYLKTFPKEERKPYKLLEKLYNRGILKTIQILDEDTFVGFILVNSVKNNKCLLVDYFAILSEHQDKGYGTKAIQMLRESSKEYYGIFIEVDKEDLGTDANENKLRRRRIEFYERLGFYRLNFDINLFNVIFTPYILPTLDTKQDEQKILKDVFEIYYSILGKKETEKYCKII